MQHSLVYRGLSPSTTVHERPSHVSRLNDHESRSSRVSVGLVLVQDITVPRAFGVGQQALFEVAHEGEVEVAVERSAERPGIRENSNGLQYPTEATLPACMRRKTTMQEGQRVSCPVNCTIPGYSGWCRRSAMN